MAVAYVMQFDGVGQQDYDDAMEVLDLAAPGALDRTNDWPDGLITHLAAATPKGWCVVDTWESDAKFGAFFESRLGPALAKVGIPEPNVTVAEIYNTHTS